MEKQEPSWCVAHSHEVPSGRSVLRESRCVRNQMVPRRCLELGEINTNRLGVCTGTSSCGFKEDGFALTLMASKCVDNEFLADSIDDCWSLLVWESAVRTH